MRAAIAVKHHDHNHVEKRGGWELYTHLRAAPSRARARREAIDRAGRLFEEGLKDQQASADERNGRALIVLQRTLLALEDLGSLLHAFRGADQWNRLRNARYDELDEAFEAAVADPDVLIGRLWLADRETLTAEGLPADQAVAKAVRLHAEVESEGPAAWKLKTTISERAASVDGHEDPAVKAGLHAVLEQLQALL